MNIFIPGGFNLSLKIVLFSPAWLGKPYWKYLKVTQGPINDAVEWQHLQN